MSARIQPVDPAHASGKVQEFFAAIQSKLGVVPNMMRTMAQSPAVLEGYLGLINALSKGSLSTRTREQLALTVGQANQCEYCVAAHTVLGAKAGITPQQILDARRGAASFDRESHAALKLARAIVDSRGQVSDAELTEARSGGLDDAKIAEVVGAVGLNVLTNYFNIVAGTDVDFPKVALAL